MKRTAPPNRRPPFWKTHRDLIALVAAVATVLAVVLPFVVGGGTPNPVQAKARVLLQQVAQRDIWVSKPQLFASAFPPGPFRSAAVSGDSFVILTPHEAVQRAAEFIGVPVFVVGQVAEVRSVPSKVNVNREIEFTPDSDTAAYVASDRASVASIGNGVIAIVLARVAAIGQTRGRGDRTYAAVYLVARDYGEICTYDQTGDADCGTTGPLLDAVQNLALKLWGHR